MKKGKLRLKTEHKEVISDIKDVVISYTPLSGIIDTGKFLNKWLLKRRVARRVGTSINKRYRMFVLERIAKKYGSP